MKSSTIIINLPIEFDQIVDLIKQLPDEQKLKLSEVLIKESGKGKKKDKPSTYIASEKVLAKDWLLAEEDEAWKDL